MKIGRDARAAARHRPRIELVQLLQAGIDEHAPWLARPGQAPATTAHRDLLGLQRHLLVLSRSQAEAERLADMLHARIDAWNMESPGHEVAPAGAVRLVPASREAWTVRDLAALPHVRALRQAHEATIRHHLPAEPSAAQLFGLCLTSAILDSACLHARYLKVLARWLLDPHSRIGVADGLPPWIELKYRGDARRRLSVSSGVDADGAHALRRLFLAPRTAEMIGRFWSLPSRLRATVDPDASLLPLMLAATGLSARGFPTMSRLLRGVALDLQASQGGRSQLMTSLASGQLQSLAAPSDLWLRALELHDDGPAPASPDIPMATDWLADLTLQPERPSHRMPRTVVDSPAYLKFYMAIHGISDRGEEDRPLRRTRAQMIHDLEAARHDSAHVDILQLLGAWYLHLLRHEGLRPSSVERYDDTLGLRLCLIAEDMPLQGQSADILETLYAEVIESDSRSSAERLNLCRRLRSLHDFAMGFWGLPQVDPEIFSIDEGTARMHVRASLLSHADITAAREAIGRKFALPPEMAHTLQAAFLLCMRGALRIGEVTKAMFEHLEDIPLDHPHGDDAVLFIRSSQLGSNKTPNARRQIRPYRMMNAAEREFFRNWLAHRRRLGAKGQLFAWRGPGNVAMPFDRRSMARLFAEALREATGLRNVTAHSLRRAGINTAFLALCEPDMPALDEKVLSGLTGLSAQERAVLARTIAGRSRRDRWDALARFAGHADPGTTFGHYVSLADLAIHQTMAHQHDDPHGIWQQHFELLPQRLHRFAPLQIQDHTPASPVALQLEPGSRTLALRIALSGIDQGMSLRQAGMAAGVPEHEVQAWAACARAWSGMTTSRGIPRLQPEGASHRLCPPGLPAPKLAESMDLADRLIAMHEAGQPIDWWIDQTLSQASRTNSGVTFREPEMARRWIAIALQLRPAERWLLERISPRIEPGLRQARERIWQGIRPEGMQAQARRVAQGATVQARIRLLAPLMAEQSRTPAASWAGCITSAAHHAAVAVRAFPK